MCKKKERKKIPDLKTCTKLRRSYQRYVVLKRSHSSPEARGRSSVAPTEGSALQPAALHQLVLSVQSSRQRLGRPCVHVASTAAEGDNTVINTDGTKSAAALCASSEVMML